MHHLKFLIATLVCLIIGTVIWITKDSSGPVARHVCSPVPQSVRVLAYERTRDWLIFDVEPEYRIAFTATSQDLASIVKRRSGVVSRARAWVSARGGPAWFRPVTMTTNGVLYEFRKNNPAEYRVASVTVCDARGGGRLVFAANN
ncbi:MAG: hypothetical protein O2960_29845, partial [Verrucomicrobia bacterium]|nr:hypothetical protein [Verrucomicrobiota bacterium]